MSFSVTSAKQKFTPAGHCFIIHLPGGGQWPLVRDSEPIRLIEIPTSPSLYMLIMIVTIILIVVIMTTIINYNDKLNNRVGHIWYKIFGVQS